MAIGGNNCNCKSNQEGGDGKKRKLTKYNIFISKELKRLKKNNPKIDHKIAFKEAANNWSKNKK